MIDPKGCYGYQPNKQTIGETLAYALESVRKDIKAKEYNISENEVLLIAYERQCFEVARGQDVGIYGLLRHMILERMQNKKE
jgi:hypothetical protein